MELNTLIDIYCKAWSEPIKSTRARLLNAVLASEATYTDPTVHARGAAELLDHIERVLAKRPGSKVVRTSEVDQHHGIARFAWRAVESNGVQLPEGIDIVFLSGDGSRIQRIVGFFGPVKRRGH